MRNRCIGGALQPSFGRNTPAEQISVPIPAGHKSITLRLLGSESFGAWAHAGFMID